MRAAILMTLSAAWIISLLLTWWWPPFRWFLWIMALLSVVALYDILQTRHALWRNFPIIGRGRWVMEFFRPFLRQYFFESETSGVPINRMFRSVIYQRAKGEMDSLPYGTRLDTRALGYEWIGHSLSAIHYDRSAKAPRVIIGGPDCQQPYAASIFNISAMSFGALSANAIRALNLGAKQGNFYHNTGEGSVSPYHLEHGGDLVWQIGTGYFGCRDNEGRFDPDAFATTAKLPSVKMIEIKLSQGAKPGHGGILPADKNTAEIARIRLVEPGTRVDSPPAHSSFHTPLQMVKFIAQLRELSGGKPIGFKLCIGRKSEFVGICKAIHETGILPDFITVDGGEGGTGAAPLEYSNSVGMPLSDALVFVTDTLTGFGLRKHIKVIASGKTFTGFHLVKHFALGADVCNSARGMMVALGCVQSLVCNTNECPTGIATQDQSLAKGLVVSNKAQRVCRYHGETVHATMDIISSAGLRNPSQLNRSHVFRRVTETEVKRLDEIYPSVAEGCLLRDDYPDCFSQAMSESSAHYFTPAKYIIECYSGLEEMPEDHERVS
ncbi:FMN-binding glutamate synthase family protein [Aestuariibacter halophilus]|uniref:FMN-binding glutamate synthase family protein n=1 Tax=Fluctibacter halophilus TaxID=226011 RepID=A0ABS8G660_9ALTE|nr:FMN-binding glutamate synthase family protein [Aestuariibacter halophilus]MCC2616040.1 FMN-binding glutamate synthase family protein [Aestuariibacter halophilus]